MRLTVEGAATRLEGPLLFLRRTLDVGLHDAVEVRGSDGRPRLGRIAAIDEQFMTIEVLESTSGMALESSVVRFLGEPLTFGLGPGLLGRVFNGVGQVIDGGPPVAAHRHMPIDGLPMNPVARASPRDFIETGITDARPAEQPRARPEAAAVLGRRPAARSPRRRDRRSCTPAPEGAFGAPRSVRRVVAGAGQRRGLRHRLRRDRHAARQRRVLPAQPRAARRARAHGAVPQPGERLEHAAPADAALRAHAPPSTWPSSWAGTCSSSSPT